MVDISSAVHGPVVFRSFASLRYATGLIAFLIWPISLVGLMMTWAWGKPFIGSFDQLRSKLCHSWVVPRVGYHYFMPFATKGVNKQIETAILKADSLGVKVLSLAALNKTWIVGKWITRREQNWARAGTHFHQFVVPPISPFRSDCTYGDLAVMRLPDDVQGLGCCEYTMERGVVHACHARGVVHALEGWEHHEVGPIDIDMIDMASCIEAWHETSLLSPS